MTVISKPIDSCRNCPLYERPYVGPSGNWESTILIVGEAPGKTEAREGVPFIGQSGQLLNAILNHYGLSRNDVFITNTVLCHPERNAKPTQEELNFCSKNLESLVASLRPKVIACMGATALKQVLSLFNPEVAPTVEKITFEHGRVFKGKFYETEFNIVGIYHPAYILRNPGLFKDLVDDFGRLTSDYRDPPEVSYYVPKNEKEAVTFLNRLREKLSSNADSILVCDLETDGLDPRINEPSDGSIYQYPLLCVGLAWGKNTAFIIPGEFLYYKPNGVAEALEKLLMDESYRVVGHNFKFDISWLYYQLGICHPRKMFYTYDDTMLMSYVCDERSGSRGKGVEGVKGNHGLKRLCNYYLGTGQYDKALGKKFTTAPKRTLYLYCARDVVYNWYLVDFLVEKMLSEDVLTAYSMIKHAAYAISQVELNGMHVDIEKLEENDKYFSDTIQHLKDDLRNITGSPSYNPNSVPQTKFLLYEYFRLPPQKTHAGKLTTNAAALEHLSEITTGKGKEFVDKLLEYRAVSKLYNTYVKGLRDYIVKEFVHANINLTSTVTGRLSSSNPSLMNIPRPTTNKYSSRIRSQFAAPEHYYFAQVDYSQAELRTIGYLVYREYGDNFFSKCYKEGLDVHNEAAKMIFNKDTITKEERVLAKGFNFGLLYGESAKGTAERYNIDIRQADEWHRMYFSRMPKVKKWLEEQRRLAVTQGYLRSIFGFKRRFGLVIDRTLGSVERQAGNFETQHVASYLTLMALTQVVESNLNVTVTMMVHDSILFRVPSEYLIENPYGEILEVLRIFEETPNSLLPGLPFKFVADCEIGKNWGELKKVSRKELEDNAYNNS